MSGITRSELLHAALMGRRIRSAEVLEEEGYTIIRLRIDEGDVVAITGLGLDLPC